MTLKKEIEDYTNKWQAMLCSWIGRINMIKMSVLHKAACRFNAIPMKIAKAFFHRTRTNNLKIYIKPQKNSELLIQS